MVQIKLWRYKGRYNAVYKSNSDLIGEITVQGEFRDAVNVVNPQVTFEYDIGGSDETMLLKMNYAYIDATRRYYFITNIELTRKNLVTLTLHCDVLNSHINILSTNSHGYISRNEFNYDALLPDDRRTTKNEYIRSTITSGLRGSLATFTFSVPAKDQYNVVLTYGIVGTDTLNTLQLIRARASGTANDIISLTPNLTTENNDVRAGFLQTSAFDIVLTPLEASNVLAYVYANDTLRPFVNTVMVYPFIPAMSGATARLKIGDMIIYEADGTTQVSGGLLKEIVSNRLVIADFVISNTLFGITDYTDLNPYAYYQMYIPFYGNFELNVSHLLNHRILVYYVVNYYTNQSSVYVYDYTDGNVLLTSKVLLGREVPINISNMLEVQTKEQQTLQNTFLNLVAGTVATVGGIASGNPLLIAGGVAGGFISGVKAVSSASQTLTTNYKKAQLSFNDDTTSLYTSLEVKIHKIKPEVYYRLTNNFLHENGGVTNTYVTDLAGISGYTEFADLEVVLDSSITGDYRPFAPTTEEINEFIDLCKKGVYF